MPLAQQRVDLRQDVGIVDGRWRDIRQPIGDLAQHLPQDLAGTRLRQPFDDHRPFEVCKCADGLAHHLYQLPLQLLFANVGGPGQGFTDTVFDDEAAVTIASGTAPFTGSYRPQALLSGFDGLTANCNWSLQITDGYSVDTGSLTAWSITIASSTEQFTENAAHGPNIDGS